MVWLFLRSFKRGRAINSAIEASASSKWDDPESLPLITTQIPIYNELNVAERVMRAAAAMEYAGEKVRFNSIAAGLIKTDMTEAFFDMEPILEGHLDATPAGRMGTLDDMAEAALFLADDTRSGYINGQVLDLAGGQQMGRLPSF